MKNEQPTHLDLFSGIGGFALAAQWAGFRTIGFCEIDKYCQKVLAKNFLAQPYSAGGWSSYRHAVHKGRKSSKSGGASLSKKSDWVYDLTKPDPRAASPIFSDIFDLDGRDFAGVSLITGGFPCQPFSVAGKRRGAADDRAIWPEMFRVIKEARPAWVLGENVPGIVPMELDNVLSDLEGIGYSTRSFVIPACAVDARHRRDRLWILAHATDDGSHRNDSSSGDEGAESEDCVQQRSGRTSGVEGLCEHIPSSANGRLPRSEHESGCKERQGSTSPIRTFATDHCRWQSEPDVGRVVDGLSLELDFARQITAHEHSHRSEKKSERNILVRKLLRAVWEHRELATASPDLYVKRLQDSVPEVPLRDSQSRWLLGSRIEKRSNLCDLWREFYAEGFASAQDLQFKLLEQARQAKREQTLGNRVNRLKGLGNAIVPQVAYEIMREIRKLC